MLTATQIEAARKDLPCSWSRAQDEAQEAFAAAAEVEEEEVRAEFMKGAREDQECADALKVALDALAAYSRVVALLESKEPEGLDILLYITPNELRRALEG
jgi:hypothetical protein